jgi:uncharacterized protein YigA (DUF484 family)
MNIQTERQLDVTRRKLHRLEERLRALDAAPAANPVTRDLTRRSLRRLANQLKEEIARFGARRSVSLG